MSSPASTSDYAALDHAELIDRLAHLEQSLQPQKTDLEQANQRLRERNAMLEERVRWFEQQLFGRSSERRIDEQINPYCNPPIFSASQKRSYAAIISFCMGVMPPSAMFGRS